MKFRAIQSGDVIIHAFLMLLHVQILSLNVSRIYSEQCTLMQIAQS